MKLLCPVDQAECFRRGIDYNSSTIKLDINPATLPLELREYIGDHLVEGHIIPREEKFLLGSPEIEGFFKAVLFAMEYDEAVKSGRCATPGLLLGSSSSNLFGTRRRFGPFGRDSFVQRVDEKYGCAGIRGPSGEDPQEGRRVDKIAVAKANQSDGDGEDKAGRRIHVGLEVEAGQGKILSRVVHRVSPERCQENAARRECRPGSVLLCVPNREDFES